MTSKFPAATPSVSASIPRLSDQSVIDTMEQAEMIDPATNQERMPPAPRERHAVSACGAGKHNRRRQEMERPHT